MGIKTSIYCDSTVNAVMGCTGCELLEDHCYARRLCNRYASRKGWPEDFAKPEHFPGRLERALKWKDLTGTKRPDKPWLDGMPRIIFVNDLSDGFCPGGVAPDDWLDPWLDTLANSPHIWLFLTKWPGRMRKWFGTHKVPDNFWLGATLLRQSDTWRLDELLQISGGKKWASCEPLLGALDISEYLTAWLCTEHGNQKYPGGFRPSLDFVVSGGETGPGARPMRPDWVRGLRGQCNAAEVPFFFKSWGEWLHFERRGLPGHGYYYAANGERIAISDIIDRPHEIRGDNGIVRIGSKRAGNKLDEVKWQQMPEARE